MSRRTTHIDAPLKCRRRRRAYFRRENTGNLKNGKTRKTHTHSQQPVVHTKAGKPEHKVPRDDELAWREKSICDEPVFIVVDEDSPLEDTEKGRIPEFDF